MIGDQQAEAEGETLQQIEQETFAQLPFKRIADPEDIGNVIWLMASPTASYVSGRIIPVDCTMGVFL